MVAAVSLMTMPLAPPGATKPAAGCEVPVNVEVAFQERTQALRLAWAALIKPRLRRLDGASAGGVSCRAIPST